MFECSAALLPVSMAWKKGVIVPYQCLGALQENSCVCGRCLCVLIEGLMDEHQVIESEYCEIDTSINHLISSLAGN